MLEVRFVKQYPGFTLDVDFVAQAAITALIGPSGSGKSQTLRAVAGAVQPDGGRIVLDGHVLYDRARGVDLPSQRRRVGYVPQAYALFPHLDVMANVTYGLRGAGAPGPRARTAELLETLGLAGLERRRPRELSGGQQQRVAVARALLVEPRMLLLDEPFAALDSTIRPSVRDELRAIQQRLGFRALLVTHDPEDLVLADQRFTFADGRVIEETALPAGEQRSPSGSGPRAGW